MQAAASPAAAEQGLSTRPETFSRIFWRRLRKNKLAVAGAVIMCALYLVAIFAPSLAPYDPAAQVLTDRLKPPGWVSRAEGRVYRLGTDELGRDVLSRMIYGSRISLSIGFISVGISLTVGTLIGSIAGYYRGPADNLLMRLTDIVASFPTLVLIITVSALLKPSIFNIMAVIGLTSWPNVARLVRGEFLTLRERDYVEAAKAMGGRDARVIFRHILPNAAGPLIVAATLGVASAILTEAILSFLGLGVQPPTPSWGNMLEEARNYLRQAWWTAIFPGAAIFVTVLSFNLLGDGLRDALDPRLKE